MRSPIIPKIIAPSGRKAKPTANKASAAISAEVGSSPARNTLAMTGVSDPKMKKSYHSNAVPADDAVTTRVMPHDCADLCSFIRWAPLAPSNNRSAAGGKRGSERSLLGAGDDLVDVRDGKAELAHRHAVDEAAPAGLDRKHLFGLQP